MILSCQRRQWFSESVIIGPGGANLLETNVGTMIESNMDEGNGREK